MVRSLTSPIHDSHNASELIHKYSIQNFKFFLEIFVLFKKRKLKWKVFKIDVATFLVHLGFRDWDFSSGEPEVGPHSFICEAFQGFDFIFYI